MEGDLFLPFQAVDRNHHLQLFDVPLSHLTITLHSTENGEVNPLIHSLGTMKAIFSDIEQSASIGGHSTITEITYRKGSCIAFIETYPTPQKWKVTFSSVIGFRVLDERDLSEFWANNTEYSKKVDNTFLTQIVSGGWLRWEEIFPTFISTGFYGRALEFLIPGDYECLNVICSEYPEVELVEEIYD